MTQRLYEQDAYCRRFTARVLCCEPAGDRCAVVLDRTAFFPEGGGQAADTGRLDGVAVLDVQTDGETITHYTAAALPVGQTVTGELDWPQRFCRMQKHTGEHIVSGLIHREYGLENVGFHLGHEDVTLDLNGELSREQLDRIEDMANAAVADDRPVTARYPSEQELAGMAYRSKKALAGAVRIVTVEGIDVCACCAPHVPSTGQIGVIKLLDALRYKGGMRIHMQCGRDALLDYRMRYAQTATVAAALSVRQDAVTAAVERLLEQKEQLARQLRQAQRTLLLQRAKEIAPGTGAVCLITGPLESALLQELATAVKSRCEHFCAVFAGEDDTGYQYMLLGQAPPALQERMTAQLGARGGGRDGVLRGRVTATVQQIRTFFAGEAAGGTCQSAVSVL